MIGGFKKKLELAATLCDKRLVETKHGLHFGERGNKRLTGRLWIPAAELTIVIIIFIANMLTTDREIG